MKENQSTVALVEIGGSHDECLLSQLVALKSRNCKVILVCNQRIKERNPHFTKWVDQWIIVDFFSKAWKDFIIVRKMMKDIRKTGAEFVVFNTAQGGIVRNAAVISLFSKIRFSGIIHTTRKFEGSFTQKIIFWKIKRYLVLSEHLLNSVAPSKKLDIDYFYPLRFPKGGPIVQTTHQEFQITLIGGVENRRKDLAGFINMIAETKSTHFTFLGKSDPKSTEVIQFKTELEKRGISQQITLFDSFVSHEQFDSVLQNTDAILPLIHPGTASADQYFKNQIAGAMTVAFSYKIPLLLHKSYAGIKEMQPASIYYSTPKFKQVIEQLSEQKTTIIKKMSNHKAYQEEYQEGRYLDFVLAEK